MRPPPRLHLLLDRAPRSRPRRSRRARRPRCARACGRGPAACSDVAHLVGHAVRARTARPTPGTSSSPGSTPLSDRARPSVTTKPSRASAIAGSTRRCQGSLPCSFQARCRPATVPGTPTARWLSWWQLRVVLAVASGTSSAWRPRAPSRGSRRRPARPRPAGSSRKPPPPMLPAVGWVTASANAVATAASTALPPSPQHLDARPARR